MRVTGPGPARVLVIHVLLCGVLGGAALSFLTRTTVWPFCHYPMFAALETGAPRSVLELSVVRGHLEEPFRLEQSVFFRDFDLTSLRAVLARLEEQEGGAGAPTERLLELVLVDLRERAVLAGKEPPEAVRLYRVQVGVPAPRPSRHLLAEVGHAR